MNLWTLALGIVIGVIACAVVVWWWVVKDWTWPS